MKLISQILAMVLPGLKPEDASIQLLVMLLLLKAQWLVFITAAMYFIKKLQKPDYRDTGRIPCFALCQ